jgi:hypothetical protein
MMKVVWEEYVARIEKQEHLAVHDFLFLAQARRAGKFPVHLKGTFDDFGCKFFIFQYGNFLDTGFTLRNARTARFLERITWTI